MLLELLNSLSHVFYMALHVVNAGSFPRPLTADKEHEYLEAYRKGGDNHARDQLIEHNLRLVAHIIKKYYSSVRDQDDLISIGTIGLIKAVNTFDYTKGTRLATYASRCIENEILMLIRANKKHKNTLSLSDPVGLDKDGNELTLLDVLAEKEEGVFENVERSVQRERLLKSIRALLSEREYTVLCMRYALTGGAPKAQREVAAKLNISRSYVSRIEKRAIARLKKRLSASDFYDAESRF